MMRAIFLDDMEWRHESFDLTHGSGFEEVVHVWDAENFFKEMDDNPDGFSWLFLDHDLSTKSIMCDPNDHALDELTGTDVANWLVAHISPTLVPGGIVCHSLNPAGRQNMVNILRDAGFYVRDLPFGDLIMRARFGRK